MMSEIYGTLPIFWNRFVSVKFIDPTILETLALFRIFGTFSIIMRRTTYSMLNNYNAEKCDRMSNITKISGNCVSPYSVFRKTTIWNLRLSNWKTTHCNHMYGKLYLQAFTTLIVYVKNVVIAWHLNNGEFLSMGTTKSYFL